jgi:hypothetical protein
MTALARMPRSVFALALLAALAGTPPVAAQETEDPYL